MQTAFLRVLTLVGVELVCKRLKFMWYGPPGRVPTPLNTSAYSCRLYSLVVGNGWVFPFIVIELSHQVTCGDFGLCSVPDFALVAALCSSCAVWSNFDRSNLGLVCRLSIDCAVWLNFDRSSFLLNLGSDCRLLHSL